jgi:hypothetical protein
MLTIKDMFDIRDTKFTTGAVYPPEKQKFLENKLRETAAAQGIEVQGAPRQMTYVFTLDEVFGLLQEFEGDSG